MRFEGSADSLESLVVLKEQLTQISEIINSLDGDKFDRVKELLLLLNKDQSLCMSEEEVAETLRCSVGLIRKSRGDRVKYKGPPHMKLFESDKVAYCRKDVEEWVQRHPRKGVDVSANNIIKRRGKVA